MGLGVGIMVKRRYKREAWRHKECKNRERSMCVKHHADGEGGEYTI